LSTQSGYRRAWFGAERYDTFLNATAYEDDDLDYLGMIFCTQQFPTIPGTLKTADFARDYRRVEARE
jgi:hypothetical protein